MDFEQYVARAIKEQTPVEITANIRYMAVCAEGYIRYEDSEGRVFLEENVILPVLRKPGMERLEEKADAFEGLATLRIKGHFSRR